MKLKMKADGDQQNAHVATADTPIYALCSNMPTWENLFPTGVKLGQI